MCACLCAHAYVHVSCVYMCTCMHIHVCTHQVCIRITKRTSHDFFSSKPLKLFLHSWKTLTYPCYFNSHYCYRNFTKTVLNLHHRDLTKFPMSHWAQDPLCKHTTSDGLSKPCPVNRLKHTQKPIPDYYNHNIPQLYLLYGLLGTAAQMLTAMVNVKKGKIWHAT